MNQLNMSFVCGCRLGGGGNCFGITLGSGGYTVYTECHLVVCSERYPHSLRQLLKMDSLFGPPTPWHGGDDGSDGQRPHLISEAIGISYGTAYVDARKWPKKVRF